MVARRREQLLDDKVWKEVELLNGYAVLIGYITMAVKGLGYLVLTWTTVVLLGGFVSILHTKDFWCLTFITLVQTAGIFDVTLNDKLSHMISSVYGLMMATGLSVMVSPINLLPLLARLSLLYVLWVVQLLVLVLILCPLTTIYVFGILMSGGISLCRLIEHDYRGGEASNLMPAMDTLYYLALLQAVLFCFRFVLGRAAKNLTKQVVNKDHLSEVRVVDNYLQETKRGCEKDPSFVKGRNFITHAIEMIASKSPVDCISGVGMLWTAIFIAEADLEEAEGKKESESDNYQLQRDIINGQRMLMKHLVLSAASSRQIIQKLLETLDSRGLHDTKTRGQAANIVEHLACNINLEHFPGGIHHISSIMGTFEEFLIAQPYQQVYLFHEHEADWDVGARCLPPSPYPHRPHGDIYRDLLRRGLNILRRLAAHKDNCRVMSDTPDLISKIMAPITSDLLHNTTDDHGGWSNIVQLSMRVVNQLATAPGETGAKLRHEISSCQGAISTLWRILNCNECGEGLQKYAIWILRHLYMDAESGSRENLVLKKESREDFFRMLVDIFTHHKNSTIKEVAGEALWEVLCVRSGISDAMIVIQTDGGDVIDSLADILVHDNNMTCRRAAAIILEHLCTHYTKDDEYIVKLKRAIVYLMPEVLRKILCSGDETHTGLESDQNRLAKPETDIDNQCDDMQENDEQEKEEEAFDAVMDSAESVHLLSSMLSLCGTVCHVFISELAPDLAPQFHTPSFVNKLKEIAEKHRDPTAENLSLLKSIGKMVIAIMKHSSWFVRKEDLESLIGALSRVSKNMDEFDHSIIFRCDRRLETTLKLDRRTLASLVKEAKESYDWCYLPV